MPQRTPWTDEYTPLCERCGYVLEGIASEGGNCPECGKPVAESLPGARSGSAYQQSPTVGGFVRTVVDMHRRPGQLFRALRIEPRTDRGLALRACAASGLVTALALGFALAAAGVQFRPSPSYGARDAAWVVRTLGLMLLLLGAGPALVGLVLTVIEGLGVVYFSRRRGWRVPRDVASAVCAHAACLWWVAGVGLALGIAAGLRVEAALMPITAGTPYDSLARYAGPVLGFTLGMMAFETLVWLGVRECKFINRERAGLGAGESGGRTGAGSAPEAGDAGGGA